MDRFFILTGEQFAITYNQSLSCQTVGYHNRFKLVNQDPLYITNLYSVDGWFKVKELKQVRL